MFAEKTKVPAEKSAGEIKKALTQFGTENFSLKTERDKASIGFTYKNVAVKVRFSLPEKPGKSSTIAQRKKYEQATNTRWRQLLLCIKAKLESVCMNIETFDQAFMAHIEGQPILKQNKRKVSAGNPKVKSKLAKAS